MPVDYQPQTEYTTELDLLNGALLSFDSGSQQAIRGGYCQGDRAQWSEAKFSVVQTS